MYTNSTALITYKNIDDLYSSSLIEFISITCLCTLLISMTASIIKNPHIRRMTGFMKYLYFFAAIANLTQLYSVKHHNSDSSKPNTSTNINPIHWNTCSYFTNSTYAMYSLLHWPWKNHINGWYIDDASNISQKSHIDHTTTQITEKHKHTKSSCKKYNNFSCGTPYNYCSNGENIITPKYKDLKDELLNNNIYTITEQQYQKLHNECVQLHQTKGHKIKAKDVGIINQQYNIQKGTALSIKHLIVLKLYTDYTKLQNQFKMYLRSEDYAHDINNCEIYYFFKYLKESCVVFGDKIRRQRLYTGIKQKLLFDSLTNTFHCPLSTTTEIGVAQNFAGDNGVVLALKAVSKNERYFDLSWISQYLHEREKLVMASPMKICDIFVGGESMKKYIAAMNLMQQFCDGNIRNVKQKNEEMLYQILAFEFDQISFICGEYVIKLFSNIMKKLKQNFHYDYTQWSDQLNRISDLKLKLLLSEGGPVFEYMFTTT